VVKFTHASEGTPSLWAEIPTFGIAFALKSAKKTGSNFSTSAIGKQKMIEITP
jgi:hypothetical protein